MVRQGWLTLIAALALTFIASIAARGARAQAVSGTATASASAQASDAPPASAAPESNGEEPAWALLHRAYNTWSGSTGGLFVEDPGMGAPGAVRVQLGLASFSGEDFLYDGDDVELNTQSLSLSVTALEMLELHASLGNRGAVTNVPEAGALHTLGDLAFGAKVGWPIGDVLRAGAGVRFAFRNDIGPDDAALDSTSIGLRGLLALDLQRLPSSVPLVVRFNLDYLFDNSARVIEDIEDARYASLPDPLPPADEVAHLVSRFERYGLNVNRVDMLTPALGVEVPLAVMRDFYVYPMLEYRLGIPVNRDGYDCGYYLGESDRGSNNAGADDTCLHDVGFEAYPMHLSLGVRVAPPVRSVSIALGVDLGLNGTSTFVRELAPVSPFELLLALSYDYDAEPEPPPPAPPAPPAPVPAPPSGRLNGTVIDAATNVPIPSVVVALPGAEHTPLATNIAGRFVTYELPPGEVRLELSHPDYSAGSCSGVIAASGGDAEVQCALAALPVAGSLSVSVRSVYGAPIAGVRVALVGGSGAGPSAATDADGEARFGELQPGEYQVRVEPDGHLWRVSRTVVQPRQAAALEVALADQPAKPALKLNGKEVRSTALKLEPNAAQLAPTAPAALAELADLMLRKPELGKLRVQADGEEGLALARAMVIKQGLLDLGVPEARVETIPEPGKTLSLTFE